jgi:hypothetical protein
LEEKDIEMKNALEEQKKMFERENDTLRKQVEQQIEFNKLINKVKNSRKKIKGM